MSYKKLILRGYHRLALSGVKDIEIEFNDPTLLILGTNGSGKSSLLWECNMLPPNPNNFLEVGYKYIEKEHAGHLWAAEMVKDGSVKYQFYKDGVPLNEGRGISMQRDLIKNHLQMTPDLHKLFYGADKFTTMDAAKRKEWLLKICDADYSFAMQAYKEFCVQHRDTKGALRVAQKQLIIESEKLVEDSEQLKLKKKAHELQEAISVLLEHKMPLTHTAQQAREKTMEVERRILQVTQQIDAIDSSMGQMSIEPDKPIADLRFEKAVLTERVSRLTQELSNYTQVIKTLELANVGSTAQLESSLNELELQLNELKSRRVFPVFTVSSDTVRTYFLHCRDTLVSLSLGLPDDFKDKTDIKKLQSLQSRQKELLRVVKASSEERQLVLTKLTHMQQHKDSPDVMCPKCDHVFSSVYSPSEAAKLEASAQLLQLRINAAEIELGGLQETMESFIECIRVLQQYMALRRDLPALMSLWDYIGEQKILSEQAGTLGEVLNRFDAEIDLVERIERLEKKQRDLTEQMKLVSQNSLLSLAQAQDSRTKCEQELSGAMTAMDKVSASIKRLEDRLAQERQLEARAKALMGLYQEYKKAHIGEVEVVRRQTYNQLIQELTSSLGYIESQIKTIDTQRQIVEQIKAQIEGYTKNESGLKAICQALSPSEGLIAQGLYSFMEGFVDQVNEVIARMWTYDLQVLPCKYTGDSVELDYKFPLSVPKSPLREDVSEGSEAMLEVVNFAFRWVAQKLLGYGDWPLFMDEFSRNFDDAHRATATHFIRDLIEAREFSQVFLISHYESVYGALQNADLCVIDDGNIALPKMNKPINEFVKINCQ